MAKGIFKPKYTKQEVSQRFNLGTMLGYSPSDIQKELFHDLVVEKIQDRTKGGNDINNNKFTPYSEDYAEFKGVSKGNVDLTLNDIMLQSFSDTNKSKQSNVVKVSIDPGVETLKAFNHNTGDTLPTRTFFGMNNKDESINGMIKEVDKLKAIKDDSITLKDLLDATESFGLESV